MSELTDYIDQIGPAAALKHVRASPYWWALSMATKSPKDLYHVISVMGWQTLTELEAWLALTNTSGIHDRTAWQTLCDPQCSIKPDQLGACAWPEMDVARDQQCVTAASYQRMNSDARYLCPTESQLRAIAQDCVSWRYQHAGTETLDCDDAVNIARGWLSSQGLGNLSAGKAGTVHYSGGTLLYGHAVLLAFSRETPASPLVAWWWEPQTGTVHPVSYARLGAGWLQFPDRVEIGLGDF